MVIREWWQQLRGGGCVTGGKRWRGSCEGEGLSWKGSGCGVVIVMIGCIGGGG